MLIASSLSASTVNNPTKRMEISTLDGTVHGFPTILYVTNGTLTDNGDGTFTLTVGTSPVVTTNNLLLENGTNLLLENGTYLTLE